MICTRWVSVLCCWGYRCHTYSATSRSNWTGYTRRPSGERCCLSSLGGWGLLQVQGVLWLLGHCLGCCLTWVGFVFHCRCGRWCQLPLWEGLGWFRHCGNFHWWLLDALHFGLSQLLMFLGRWDVYFYMQLLSVPFVHYLDNMLLGRILILFNVMLYRSSIFFTWFFRFQV
jgi:hypothetical protein